MTTIKVEATWNGSGGPSEYAFRLTMPDGKRESVRGVKWGRKTARKALDIAEHVYGYRRRNVRFDVK